MQAATEDDNIFDTLPSLAKPNHELVQDELDVYLNTDVEEVDNVLVWWNQHRTTYPHLARMALDYLTIPGECNTRSLCYLTYCCTATSVDVEQIFSRGRLILSHVRSRLSAQSTRALLCLGCWSLLGLVKDKDIMAITCLPDVEGAEEELEDGWDDIVF